MLYLLGVLIMAVGIAVSIALHEVGHMVPAKKFGVRVPQYMIGFGPTLWSRKRGETEYGFKAIPLGGYVRMIGMYPPRPQDPDGMIRTTSTGRFSQLADEMREQSLEEIQPGDENRVFYKLPTWKKVVVMFGGPFMNLVIAAVLTLIMLVGVGLPAVEGTKVGSVSQCLIPVGQGQACPPGQAAPAAKAGLQPGDELVSVAGKRVTSNLEATAMIRDNPNKTIPFVVKRAGANKTLMVTPAMHLVTQLDDKGNPVRDAKGEVVKTKAGFVGVSIGVTTLQRQSPTQAPQLLGEQLKGTALVMLNLPAKMQGVAKAAFSDEKRDPNGPASVVAVSRFAGEAASAEVALGMKVLTVLSLLASLNIALFVFNLIPLLPLDGGHIAGALWEALKRAYFRIRGVSREVYVDVTKALPLTYAVSVLLIAMSVLLIYADFVNPIRLQ